MREDSSRLDALSEMLALSSYGNTKNILMTAVEARGPLDLGALELAVSQLPKDFPELLTSIKEVRNWGRHYLLREFRPDFAIPVTASDLQVEASSVFSSFMNHLAPMLDERWDLFNSPALKFHIVRVAKDRHVIAQIAHHAVADAGKAAEIGKKLFERYDEILKGKKPEWACQPHAMSTLQKRMVRVKEPSFREILSNMRDTLGHFGEKTTLPEGNGRPQDTRQHHAKRTLSVEQTAAITKPSFSRSGSFVDSLVVCTNMAIDRWNEARKKAPGILTTSMSVSMKGRFRTFNAMNNSGLVFFMSQPEERKDPAAFARSLALSRIKQFRRQMDFKFYTDISRMNAVLRPFPFGTRSRIVNFIMNKHQFSMAITLLGVIWPETRNGKPTADTCFTRSGDLTLSEVYGVGYKLMSSTHLLLIVYVFSNQLNFVLHASGCLFTREETEAFMDLIMENLLSEPFSGAL